MEIYGILQDERRVMFVMPLMQCDLLDALGAAGRLDRALVRRWVAQLALGIDALHRVGIIHRDIKPENILLDGLRGNVRIADFNAALVVQGGRPLADGEVYAQDAVGSVPYIAWETTQHRWYGKMVDWWALGCLVFDLLTNTLLFKDDGARKTYARWDRKLEGISYLSYAGDLTDEEESVIAGFIHLHPSSRYQLRHLRYHNYFLDENRVNVFDVLLREPPADSDLLTVRTVERGARARAQAQAHGNGNGHGPGEEAFDVSGADDFSGFGWVNPRGIWGAHA
ncbi:kinase-like domain-containing protein [Daedaleopsis nitida]|nr:kinase-like domain-containing protein [Daedaleopsis nitida]